MAARMRGTSQKICEQTETNRPERDPSPRRSRWADARVKTCEEEEKTDTAEVRATEEEEEERFGSFDARY